MPDPGALRLLVVDDDPAMGAMLRQVVRSYGMPEPVVVTDGRSALDRTDSFDIILLDHQLPDTTGLDLLPSLRGRPGHPSVILVTGNGDEALAASALRQGADDYLVKDQSLPRLLPQVLERVRRTRALRQALAAAEEDLVRVERLAAIGQLHVTLHHEINNPLMSASMELELLLGRAPDGEVRSSLESIQDSLHRIRDVLKRVGELEDARTRKYVGETGMIDLEGTAGASPGISRGNALLWLATDDLARVVTLLLKHAGFRVRRLPDRAALEREANMLGVSLVVIEQPAEGPDGLGGFVPEKDRVYTLVTLVEGDGSAERKAGADYAVTLPFDPGSFTGDVLRAIEQQAEGSREKEAGQR